MIGVLTLVAGLAGTAGAAGAASDTSGSPALGTAKASSVVRAAGYTPISFAGFDPGADLSVIVGLLSTSGDGHPQRAFLFHRGEFVGNDAPQPSATIRWIWSTDRVVALQYDLYRPDDPMCCPTAGGSTARFQWNGTSVTPLDPVPTAAYSAPASRR
ncbi:LppP/LprE family lipoprotein [Frankia sp. AgB32]|uniref:LppP/LprE family lipoprotein n=1 Tax=Frankia sp. AgB32 TaxID=631119 RepID=UPI00200E3E56|nr:LppP/LprE family lipoprotein [Frankia sp. AgB32]MCK9893578.1 LppP/LprE family lipoprotein [Frankia sp. AgB32]